MDGNTVRHHFRGELAEGNLTDVEVMKEWQTNIRSYQTKGPRHLTIERAFVSWYLATRFGGAAETWVTDGARDGGIDAVVDFEGLTYIVQTEFSHIGLKHPRSGGPLSVKKYGQFDALPAVFANPEKFGRWLRTVREDVREKYREVSTKCQSNPASVVWEFATLKSRSDVGEGRLENISVDNFSYGSDLYRLHELSVVGGTPTTKSMTLGVPEYLTVEDQENGIKSYVAQANLGDLIRYVREDARLQVLALNVRSELDDKTAREIRSEIIDTYQNSPYDFWYSHNGVTIVCDRATIRGKNMEIRRPYVINGAQTIYALRDEEPDVDGAKVLVRVVEIPPEVDTIDGVKVNDFVRKIVIRTNKQNRMFAFDLLANDPVLVNLAREFLPLKVYLERRRGDSKKDRALIAQGEYARISAVRLAQLLASTHVEIGGATLAKGNREDLFDEEPFSELFGEGFRSVWFRFRSYEMVKWIMRDVVASARTQRERRVLKSSLRHAEMSTVAMFWKGVMTATTVQKTRWEVACLSRPYAVWESSALPEVTDAVSRLFKRAVQRWLAASKNTGEPSANTFFKSGEWNKRLLASVTSGDKLRVRRSLDHLFA